MVWVIFSKQKQTWGDILSRTYVITYSMEADLYFALEADRQERILAELSPVQSVPLGARLVAFLSDLGLVSSLLAFVIILLSLLGDHERSSISRRLEVENFEISRMTSIPSIWASGLAHVESTFPKQPASARTIFRGKTGYYDVYLGADYGRSHLTNLTAKVGETTTHLQVHRVGPTDKIVGYVSLFRKVLIEQGDEISLVFTDHGGKMDYLDIIPTAGGHGYFTRDTSGATWTLLQSMGFGADSYPIYIALIVLGVVIYRLLCFSIFEVSLSTLAVGFSISLGEDADFSGLRGIVMKVILIALQPVVEVLEIIRPNFEFRGWCGSPKAKPLPLFK